LKQYRIFSILRQSVAARKRVRWIQLSSLWIYRVLTWCVLAVGLVFAAAVLGLRYWILPNIDQYREDIARIVSETARQKIEIGHIRANWEGLRPQLVLEQVRVLDAQGRPALEFARVDNTLSWLSLATLQLRFHALDIHRPKLEVRRDAAGAIFVAGIEMSGQLGGGGFAGWLLRQRDIEIIDATIAWTDEQRSAPRLEFKHVHMHLINRGSRHRFGLRALPPKALAAPIDVRGDLTGDSIDALAKWNGTIFVQLDYADIAAWRQWIPFPVHFPRGQGAVRAWLTFSEHNLTGATVDVQLANVQTRLAADLPELDLSELSGRIGWKSSRTGFEFTTAKLGLTTTGGLTLPPADFRFQVVAASRSAPASGELQVDSLELEPLVALADRLPLAQEARDELARFSPRGGLRDVAIRWRGDWQKPSEYGVKGRFDRLALSPAGKFPGFRGMSGSVDAREDGGTLYLNTQKAAVEMPLTFRAPLEFDVLTAQLRWERLAGETEVWLNSISFSNADLAGTLFGTFRTVKSTRGHIDLTGNLARADLRHVGRYVPLVVGADEREWVDYAFQSGQVTAGSVRIKGDIDAMPFADGRSGVFQATARVTGATLQYARGWPMIENIAAEVVFRGPQLVVYGRQGSVFGTQLSKIRAEIPDLTAKEEMCNITGEATGPTSEFLTFIEKSPVFETIDRFTEGWKAQGDGRLDLGLNIPMRAKNKMKVKGAFQFDGNTVATHPAVPVIEQASGRIEFTESSVRARRIKGAALGGPVSITADTRGEATVVITAQGRVDTDKLKDLSAGPAWMQYARGSTDWRAVITARKRMADVVFESNLKGLAVYLPPPLLKPPQQVLPVRIERRVLSSTQDSLGVAVGDIVGAKFVRQMDGATAVIPRGVVRFGGPASEPDRAGVWLSGTISSLDLDRWLALFRQPGEPVRIDWGGVDLKLGTLDALGRRYHELSVYAVAQPDGNWRSSVVGKEFEGTLLWQPQGRGRLTARMKTLVIPPPSPATLQAPTTATGERRQLDLPALDITAEQFSLGGKVLGSLKVLATPQNADWRIEQLSIINPESTFTLEGLWEGWLAAPRTRVNLRLDAQDAGKLLERLGYSDGLKRGTAKIEGALTWQGTPYEINYPSLTGNLVLDAAKGQFDKINTGAGKLLGIMSLQALPRRVSLDFGDIFSDGFAFDEIVGPVKIQQGIALTDNFRIQGPSARVLMKGKVDLARETQELRVRVTPYLSESVSVAGALIGGPVAGIATFLAQKMLKDPINQAAAFEYDVTGTWKDPQVVKIQAEATVPEAGP
jgi:uncharacterized protein (TIGR02099 family)